MEVSMFTSFNDLGMMNDVNFNMNHQLQMNSMEELFGPAIIPNYVNNFELTGGTNQVLSCKRSSAQFVEHYHQNTVMERPSKQMKTDNNNWGCYDQMMNHNNPDHILNSSSQTNSASSTMLCFSNNSSISSNSNHVSGGLIKPKEEVAVVSNPTFIPCHDQPCVEASRTNHVDKNSVQPQQSKDHIIAERKRREKLSQRFIALSALIPGLKKMDKATVLGDAVKHVKQLQERVRALEEEAKNKKMESAVLVKRSYVTAEDEDADFSSEKNLSENNPLLFPEIEARFSEKNVLIRINCEKKQGIIEKLMSKVEQLNLVVISSSSLAFGASALALTIVAQMGSEFTMTAKDIVRQLHTILK
ncbi:unnamed protein product [Amaranthus hypochondriacus]